MCLNFTDHLNQVIVVFDIFLLLTTRGREAHLEREVRLDPMDCQDPEVLLEVQVLMGQRCVETGGTQTFKMWSV